ncbi:hypothetical protein P152DRAFT_409367, partial [Eremomyces bilateralis CBS 781.70]
MRSTLHRLSQHVSPHRTPFAIATLIVLSAFSALATPTRHSLFISALSWALVCAVYISQAGLGWRSQDGGGKSRRFAGVAGGLFALSGVCEATSRDAEALWWTKSLLPMIVYLAYALDIKLDASLAHVDTGSKPDGNISRTPPALLITATVSALIALSGRYTLPSSTALGLCGALLQGCSFVLLDMAIKSADIDFYDMGGFVMANGSRRALNAGKEGISYKGVCRDVAGAIAFISALAAASFESFRLDNGVSVLRYWKFGWRLSEAHENWDTRSVPFLVLTDVVRNLLVLYMVQRRGPLSLSFYVLFAIVVAFLLTGITLTSGWFAVLFSFTSMLFFKEPHPMMPSVAMPPHMRSIKRAVILVSIISFVFWTVRFLPDSPHPAYTGLGLFGPPAEMAPRELGSMTTHPIEQLMDDAQDQFQAILVGQSETLEQVVAEYRRRYKMHPPPNFDRWYEFAKRHDVQLVDEFDNIYDALLPFWALPPSVIRNRTAEALGYEGNALIHVAIRKGYVVKITGGEAWFRGALLGMLKDIVEFVPDMDLALNIHDEPRVIIAHDELSQMVEFAKSKAIPQAFQTKEPVKRFSPRPANLGDGRRIKPVTTSRFNHFAHQDTWTHSRLSCPPDSPARSFHETTDNLTAWAVTPLGLIYNHTAFSDICNSPSFASTHGFFQRPNAFNLIMDLVPIFSQSKVSSFSDIVYPSPWYWADHTPYNPAADIPWAQKNHTLYWRGSSTGGFSRDGGWRRQHRQRLVRILNAPSNATVLLSQPQPPPYTSHPDIFRPTNLPPTDIAPHINVHFTGLGQCDAGDCAAQREFFHIDPPARFEEAYHARHLLDMDGNAFSGRFYAFLRSHSAVLKMAVFREWHDVWVRPWVHFVPVSLRGGEVMEVVRWMRGEDGKMREMAEEGREWAGKALRRRDMEAWLLRLLLEYGRLVDEERGRIGF